jgi:hypothetical protein
MPFRFQAATRIDNITAANSEYFSSCIIANPPSLDV